MKIWLYDSGLMVRKLTAGIALSVLMLGFGWQLGVRSQQKVMVDQLRKLDSFYAGGTGSGVVLTDPEHEADLTLLWSVWKLLNRNYLLPNELDSKKMIMGATEGLVHAVGDPYTLFMSPKENTAFRDGLSGTLQGIGAELSAKDGAVIVVSPLKGSPAAKAGLLPKDIVIKVNDTLTDGLDLNKVVEMIRGPKGTTVKITIHREKVVEPIVLSIVRDDIMVPSVEAKVIDTGSGTVGYIALNQFGEHSTAEMQKELQNFQVQKVKALVLDLRYNGGGFLDGAVDVVSFFQKEGMVVSVESRGKATQHHSVSGRPIFPDLPLAVIQNEGSASASEITAGALQDHHRAVIVGTKSFGKGTVQEVIDLPGGSSLRVTIARWLTPNGKNIGKEGIHPDVEAQRSAEDVTADKDPQLDAALRAVFQKQASKMAPTSGSGA